MSRPAAASLLLRLVKRGASIFTVLIPTVAVIHSANVQAQSTTELTTKSTIDDPCGGTSSLLAILDRPTVGDSACVVPEKNVVLELGIQRVRYRDGSSGINFPEAQFRFGMAGNNELVLLLPNYTRQTSGDVVTSGPGATVVGIKHGLGYTGKWLGAVESLVTIASGNSTFGSRGTGVAFNGIVSYSPTDDTSLSVMLGVTSQTLPRLAGGSRYTSVNPDFVGTWAMTERLQLYGEIYGQSRTGPGQGAGWNADGGVQYLFTPNVEVDVEVGSRLAGNLGGFSHYVGIGLGVKY